MAAPEMTSDQQRVFAARLCVLPDTATFVQSFCDGHDVARSDALRLTLIVEELFSNTVRHGYKQEGESPIRITLSTRTGELGLLYEDAAPRYDPLSRRPDAPSSLTAALESRPVGGLGVYLVGQFVESAQYAYQDGFNRLWLRVLRRA